MSFHDAFCCAAPHLLAEDECNDDFELRMDSHAFDIHINHRFVDNNPSDSPLPGNGVLFPRENIGNQDFLKVIEELPSPPLTSPPLPSLSPKTIIVREEENNSNGSSNTSSKCKNNVKRKNNILKKMLRLGNKSKSQVYAAHDDLQEERQQPEIKKPPQCNQPAIAQNISSGSSNASNNHTRDLSTLSTTPLTCLEDDVQDFLIDLSKNSKAAAYLEKERSSIKEMKVAEAERRKDMERLQHKEQQRQVRASSIRMQFYQQNVLEQRKKGPVKVVQLDDHDLMNINQSTKVLAIKSDNATASQSKDIKNSAMSKQKCQTKRHKRYFSLHKENTVLSSITNAANAGSREDSSQSATIAKNPNEKETIMTNATTTTTTTNTEKLVRKSSLKTTDRKLFNDRRLLKRYGSLSTYDKEFMTQVFREKDQ